MIGYDLEWSGMIGYDRWWSEMIWCDRLWSVMIGYDLIWFEKKFISDQIMIWSEKNFDLIWSDLNDLKWDNRSCSIFHDRCSPVVSFVIFDVILDICDLDFDLIWFGMNGYDLICLHHWCQVGNKLTPPWVSSRYPCGSGSKLTLIINVNLIPGQNKYQVDTCLSTWYPAK